MDNEEIDGYAIEHEIDRRRDRSRCACGRELPSYARNAGLMCGECRMSAHCYAPDTRPQARTDE
jgi:hypothetical protein